MVGRAVRRVRSLRSHAVWLAPRARSSSTSTTTTQAHKRQKRSCSLHYRPDISEPFQHRAKLKSYSLKRIRLLGTLLRN
eukprot:3718516-Prymnesium_polylepis.1